MDLQAAQNLLTAYRAAEIAIITGAQEYTLVTPNGQQSVKRADLKQIQAAIKSLESQVLALSNTRKGTNRKYSLANFSGFNQ